VQSTRLLSGFEFLVYRQFCDLTLGGRAQLAADDIGIEAGAEERAVERGQLARVKWAAEAAQFALDALAHLRPGVYVAQHFVERRFDVPVGKGVKLPLPLTFVAMVPIHSAIALKTKLN
jgi:hypothetical protein